MPAIKGRSFCQIYLNQYLLTKLSKVARQFKSENVWAYKQPPFLFHRSGCVPAVLCFQLFINFFTGTSLKFKNRKISCIYSFLKIVLPLMPRKRQKSCFPFAFWPVQHFSSRDKLKSAKPSLVSRGCAPGPTRARPNKPTDWPDRAVFFFLLIMVN